MKNILLTIIILVIFFNVVKKKMITYDYIDNFLEPEKFNEIKNYKKKLTKELLKHENTLNKYGFKNTKNIVYYFNLDYLEEMKNDDILFKTISEILDKSPQIGNYIVANFLEIDPSLNEYAPSLHKDVTICKYLDCDEVPIYPEVVGVLYLEVPKCMKGGELMVFGNYNQFTKYTPKENRLLFFNGEYTHGVKGYSMNKCKANKRLSLVLEIYDLNGYQLSILPKIYFK
jgi:hypothetical protein